MCGRVRAEVIAKETATNICDVTLAMILLICEMPMTMCTIHLNTNNKHLPVEFFHPNPIRTLAIDGANHGGRT